MELEAFARDLQQDVLVRSESEENESFREEAFTEVMIECLCDHGELDDGQVCLQRGYGWKVSGYGFSMDEECLDLLIAHYSGAVPPISLPRSDVQRHFKRLATFFVQCLHEAFVNGLDESSPAFDLALRINELVKERQLERIRLFLLTDCLTRTTVLEEVEDIEFNGVRIPVSAQVWDVERLFRSWSSGRQRDAIKVDFMELFQRPLPCLVMPENPDFEYNTYLALFPGEMLYRIYEQYGPRLLERNVRSFLQAKGSVNMAIRRTIRETPRMFLAYNNGLSATAEEVETVRLTDGALAISAIKDFQIVNGGQTTASIYHAVQRDNVKIDDLYVQMKLTVLKDRERMDEVVPRISESANTQNKVQIADFSANHPFHRRLEELSRTVWAPSASSTDKQTRWFYERARGQYADARFRAGTPARQREFDIQHPKHQKFTKVDLAKFEHSWRQLPHFVSEGAQKNFAKFMAGLRDCEFVPDQPYFQQLIARAILFRRAEKLIGAQKYGGYRANIVTYTIAWMCYDSEKHGTQLDLRRIWQNQCLSQEVEESIITVSSHIFSAISHPPGNANVTEWCKREACWETIRGIEVRLSSGYYAQQVAPQVSEEVANTQTRRGRMTAEELSALQKLRELDRTVWYIILQRNREVAFLTKEQEDLAVQLMKRKPGREDIAVASSIVLAANSQGFKID
ncbi:MAG: AIPR family protein [Thaumarchaeota archaeon]|nr:AIPR family protein [Nitrososphaerota archaeon]